MTSRSSTPRNGRTWRKKSESWPPRRSSGSRPSRSGGWTGRLPAPRAPPPADIRRNATSLGFPIERWEREGKWTFVDGSVDIAEEAAIVGAYDFGALVARIERAVRQVDAKRVSLDSLGAIFTRFVDIGTV